MGWLRFTKREPRQSPSSTPPSPSPSRSGVLGSAQECVHALLDLHERRSDTRYQSFQADRLVTPDSEDASAIVSPQRVRVPYGRRLRLSGPPSPEMASLPFSDVNQFDMNINSVPWSGHQKPSGCHTTTKKTPLRALDHEDSYN